MAAALLLGLGCGSGACAGHTSTTQTQSVEHCCAAPASGTQATTNACLGCSTAPGAAFRCVHTGAPLAAPLPLFMFAQLTLPLSAACLEGTAAAWMFPMSPSALRWQNGMLMSGAFDLAGLFAQQQQAGWMVCLLLCHTCACWPAPPCHEQRHPGHPCCGSSAGWWPQQAPLPSASWCLADGSALVVASALRAPRSSLEGHQHHRTDRLERVVCHRETSRACRLDAVDGRAPACAAVLGLQEL